MRLVLFWDLRLAAAILFTVLFHAGVLPPTPKEMVAL